MTIGDTTIIGSDAWWLKRLTTRINARSPVQNRLLADSRKASFGRRDWMTMLWERLHGNTPLMNLTAKYADATLEFMRLSRTHYAATVVGALQSRVRLQGALTDGAQGSDADGDDVIREIMDQNAAFFEDALTYAFTMSTGVIIVGPPRPGERVATCTAEDPRDCAWDVDPLNPLLLRAFVKTYRDETLQQDVAHLYLLGEPSRLRVARRKSSVKWSGKLFREQEWEWDDREGVSGPLPHQEFGLPVVPLVNRYGLGEFEPYLDLLDRITNDIADRLWTQKYQTFVQRALIGDLPQFDDKGEEVDYNSIFQIDPGALWRMPAESEVWEGKQADLSGLLAASRADLLELSAVSATPMFMFTPDAAAGSAEGASMMRDAGIDKAKDRIARMSPVARRTFRLGLAYSGQVDRARGPIRPSWAPPERFSMAQRGAAAVQGKTSGVPQRSILSELWQFDPATVARMEQERATDLLFQVREGE